MRMTSSDCWFHRGLFGVVIKVSVLLFFRRDHISKISPSQKACTLRKQAKLPFKRFHVSDISLTKWKEYHVTLKIVESCGAGKK